jgi:hypothetical protein
MADKAKKAKRIKSPLDNERPIQGLSMLIRRINARSLTSIGGRPPEGCDRVVPVDEHLGTDDGKYLKDRRKPAVKHDQDPAIRVRKPDPTLEPAPQNSQLMPKHRVLGLKPHLRLDWRGQDGEDKTQKPNHSLSLGDSITSSTRIRFSVHTAAPASAPVEAKR